jgi:hypothetical protein
MGTREMRFYKVRGVTWMVLNFLKYGKVRGCGGSFIRVDEWGCRNAGDMASTKTR